MIECCSCLTAGPRYPDIKGIRNVGVDKVHWGDVDVSQCTKCNRVWLTYHTQEPQYSRSGKWVQSIIDEEQAASITPEDALEFIEAAEWLIVGGSAYGHAGLRSRGRIPGLIFGRL